MTDEQYINDLFAKEPCGYEKTPGFRAFLLDAMATIGERPRAGDVASMHMAYRAGRESHIAIGDSVRIVTANHITTNAALDDDATMCGIRIGDVGTVTAQVDAEVIAIDVNPVRCMDTVTHWYVALCDIEKAQP